MLSGYGKNIETVVFDTLQNELALLIKLSQQDDNVKKLISDGSDAGKKIRVDIQTIISNAQSCVSNIKTLSSKYPPEAPMQMFKKVLLIVYLLWSPTFNNSFKIFNF